MAASSPLTDEKDLLRKLRDGDHNAFEKLYHDYKRQLLGNLLKIVKDRETVEELVHDLFFNVWKNRHTIDPDKPIKAYLFRAASNLALNALRKAKYESRMRNVLFSMASNGYTHVEEDIRKKENADLLNRLLNQLPPQRLKAYTLCKLEGKTHKEVSELLNISEATVNDHITKANQYLRNLLPASYSSIMLLVVVYLVVY